MTTELAEFLTLTAPTYDDVQEVRAWRNADIAHLRTPFLLTEKMQSDFYYNVVCDRNSNARFWSVRPQNTQLRLVGFVGLINIQWENGLGELSLMVSPGEQGKGFGKEIVRQVLLKGFNEINLMNIFIECYFCSKAVGFWRRIRECYGGTEVILPNRKYWDGEYWASLYINFNRCDKADA